MRYDLPGVVAGSFFSTPRGVILHGSRSGIHRSKHAEYVSTANYAVNEPNGYGWGATIGEDEIAVHMAANRWGYNARAASVRFEAVEFAQYLEEDPITDGQVRAFVWFFGERRKVWPDLPIYLPTHAELDGTEVYGPYFDGKTDVFSKGSPAANELRGRILDRMEEVGIR